MQKLLALILVPLILFIVTPALAKNKKHDLDKKNLLPSIVCDPNADWKNHGEYVSCVAHMHPGGTAVSAAARSDVGKKPQGSPTPSPVTSAIITSTTNHENQALIRIRGSLLEVNNILAHLLQTLGLQNR